MIALLTGTRQNNTTQRSHVHPVSLIHSPLRSGWTENNSIKLKFTCAVTNGDDNNELPFVDVTAETFDLRVFNQ